MIIPDEWEQLSPKEQAEQLTKAGVRYFENLDHASSAAQDALHALLLCFSLAIHRYPHPPAYYWAGRVMQSQRAWQGAYECFTEAISLNPNSEDYQDRCNDLFQTHPGLKFNHSVFHSLRGDFWQLYKSSYSHDKIRACYVAQHTASISPRILNALRALMLDPDRRVKEAAEKVLAQKNLTAHNSMT